MQIYLLKLLFILFDSVLHGILPKTQKNTTQFSLEGGKINKSLFRLLRVF